jgi:gamma-glutamyltranspeptidase/glutathione hydrolase
MGRTGAVASAHPLASLAGLDVLREGGNAFDAMVAASAVVPLGEPHMSGIGGIGNATVYDARLDTCLTLDFGGVPPRERRAAAGSHGAMRSGLGAAQVPGLVAAWSALLDRYRTMRLESLLRPAIDARAGCRYL